MLDAPDRFGYALTLVSLDLNPALTKVPKNLVTLVDVIGFVVDVGFDEPVIDEGVERQKILGYFTALVHIQAGHELGDDSLRLLQVRVLAIEILSDHGFLARVKEPERAVIKHDDELKRRCAVNSGFAILIDVGVTV
jgi:hypothetical protein